MPKCPITGVLVSTADIAQDWWYSPKFSPKMFLPFSVCDDSYRPYTLLYTGMFF